MGVHVFSILNPPPSPSHPSGSSQCTSPEHPVSCIEPRLAIHFKYDNLYVSTPSSYIILPSPSPTGSKRLFYTSHFTIAIISHASKVMLKILQAWLQQYMNHELPDVQAGFRKGKGTRDQFANSVGSLKKQESSRKTPTSALLIMPKPLAVWTTANSEKFLK